MGKCAAIRSLIGGRYVERQFRSLLLSGTLSSVAAYLASFINNLAAGNLLGADALSAMTLVSPYLSFLLYAEVAVSFGVSVNVSIEAGRGNTARANEFFSQGVVTASATGVLLCALTLLFGRQILTLLSVDAELYSFSSAYLSSLALFALLAPMDCLLLSVLLVEGDRKRLCAGVLLRIGLQIPLVFLLGHFFGLAGIGLAYGLSVLLSMGLLAQHFRISNSALRFLWHFCWRDLASCLRFGVNDATAYLLIALSMLAVNRILLVRFGEAALAVFGVAFSLFSSATMAFDGVSAALEPLLGGYYGEGNPVGMRRAMLTGAAAVVAESVIAAALLMVFAGWIPALYGLISPELRAATATAIRLLSVGLLFAGLNTLWSSYFIYTERMWPAVTNTAMRLLLLRVPLVLAGSVTLGLNGVWLGFALAEALSLLFTYASVCGMARRTGGRLLVPLLVDRTKLASIELFDFDVTQENVMALCDRAEDACLSRGCGRKTALRVRLLTEEYGMSVVERNTHGRAQGELTMLFCETVRLTFRDNGRVENALVHGGDQTPLDARARGTILTSTEGNRYQLYLGDNKTTFEVQ